MRNRLNEILNTINGFYLYTDELARQYTLLIKESLEIIRRLEPPPTSMLDNAKNDAIIELGNELANRMTDHFFISTAERKKSEFKISKMLAGVAIGNVLSNMPADES